MSSGELQMGQVVVQIGKGDLYMYQYTLQMRKLRIFGLKRPLPKEAADAGKKS